MRGLRLLVGTVRVLEGLSRKFMSSQVIFFAVVLRRDPMGVRGKIVEFSGFPV